MHCGIKAVASNSSHTHKSVTFLLISTLSHFYVKGQIMSLIFILLWCHLYETRYSYHALHSSLPTEAIAAPSFSWIWSAVSKRKESICNPLFASLRYGATEPSPTSPFYLTASEGFLSTYINSIIRLLYSPPRRQNILLSRNSQIWLSLENYYLLLGVTPT